MGMNATFVEESEEQKKNGAVMPNFFVIGPARCATESLFSYLKQHPQIYMSPVKETNYFVYYGHEREYYGPGDEKALQGCRVPNLKLYQEQFGAVTDEIAIGEASPWYIYRPEVPERIHHDLPTAKVIAMLRNPIDRAYSAFGLLRLSNREPVTDFLTAFNLESQRIDAGWEPLWHYKSMGMYYEQVKRYYDRFDRSQTKIYIYDDFEVAPHAILRDIFQYLGVDDEFCPDISVRLNQSYVPKNDRVHSAVVGPSLLKSVFKPFLPRRARERLKTSVVELAVGRSGLSPEVREQLVPIFRDDILKLQELIGRDLSSWLR
jgi:hypothetical protein